MTRSDYDTLIARSLDSAQLKHVVKVMDQLANVDAWDGEIVVARGDVVLGVVWYNTEIEEWNFDPARFGERT